MSIPGVLHVYGQSGPHDEVVITGDIRGLEKLQIAIVKALVADGQADTEVMTNDGEHYDIQVRCIDLDWQDGVWQGIKLPYIKEE